MPTRELRGAGGWRGRLVAALRRPALRVGLAGVMGISLLAVPALYVLTLERDNAERRAALALPVALHQLERAIGYAGFIHHFKNAVLRPEETGYYEMAEESYQAATAALREIHQLGIAIGTDLPMSALHATLAEYHSRMSQARAAAAEGRSISEVDALVRISDTDATLDLLALENSIAEAIATWSNRERLTARQERLVLSGLLLLLALSAGAMLLTGSAAQRDRERRAQELNDRLAALGQVTSGLAHDVNNLLATIYYALELSQDEDLPPAARRYMQSASRAVARGKELTGRLLTIARPVKGHPETRAVAGLFMEVEALALPQLENSGITLRFTAAEPGLMVHCDPGLLIDSLLNLILNARNAIQHSGRGGMIHVEAQSAAAQTVRRSAQRAPEMTLAANSDSGVPLDPARRYLQISVSDDGPGMTEEVRARALEPFYTTSQDGTGVGLGLSTAFSFARGAEGDLRLDSSAGAGTVVQILLPRDPAAEAETAIDQGSPAEAAGPDAQAQAQAAPAAPAPTAPATTAARRRAPVGTARISGGAMKPPRSGAAADNLSGAKAPPVMASSQTRVLPQVPRPITLPEASPQGAAAPKASESPAAAEKATPRPRAGAPRVLLAEDETGLRLLLCETLRAAGFEVMAAENGAVALNRLREGGAASVDLLLTDVMMPELDGFGLARAARDLFPDLPVVYLTGFVGDDPETAPRPPVAGPVLRKPCPPDRLLQTLSETMNAPRLPH